MRQVLSTPNQLGLILRSARQAVHLTQAEAAARLQLSQSRLSQLETDPSAVTLDKLLPLLSMLGLELVVQHKGEGRSTGKQAW